MSEELNVKGNACFLKGEWANAVQWYSQAIEKDPAVSRYYSNRAICQIRLGCYSEGLQDANEGLGKNPDDKLAFKLYLRKAECQKNLGALAGARISFEQALILEPDSADTTDRLQQLMRVPLERDHSLYSPVDIFDTLPDAYSGAEAPTVLTGASPPISLLRCVTGIFQRRLQSDMPLVYTSFTPPSGPLALGTLLWLIGCRKIDLPLAYSYLFYNVNPLDYLRVHMDESIRHEALGFVLDMVAAEVVADESVVALSRATAILYNLYHNPSLATEKLNVITPLLDLMDHALKVAEHIKKLWAVD